MTKEIANADESPSKGKLPYESPAVVSEEIFETLALACGKLSGDCDPNPANS